MWILKTRTILSVALIQKLGWNNKTKSSTHLKIFSTFFQVIIECSFGNYKYMKRKEKNLRECIVLHIYNDNLQKCYQNASEEVTAGVRGHRSQKGTQTSLRMGSKFDSLWLFQFDVFCPEISSNFCCITNIKIIMNRFVGWGAINLADGKKCGKVNSRWAYIRPSVCPFIHQCVFNPWYLRHFICTVFNILRWRYLVQLHHS